MFREDVLSSQDEKLTPAGRVSQALDQIAQMVRDTPQPTTGDATTSRSVEDAVGRLKRRVADKDQ